MLNAYALGFETGQGPQEAGWAVLWLKMLSNWQTRPKYFNYRYLNSCNVRALILAGVGYFAITANGILPK